MMKKIRLLFASPILIRIATIGLNFFSNIIINRSLGIALKGQYTTIFNYANFLQLFLNLGICYAYPIIKKEKGSCVAKKLILTIIWLQAIIFLIISVILSFFIHSISALLIVVLTTILICNNQIVFVALIDDIRLRNLTLLESTFFFVVLNAIGVIVFKRNLYFVVALLIIKYLYEVIIISKKYQYFIFDLDQINVKMIRQIIRVGIPSAAMVILITCNYNIDILLLNWLESGDVQVGIYGVAYTLSNILWVVPDAFKELVYNKSAKEDDYKFILKCIWVNMFICILLLLGFSILGKHFLKLVYGTEYVVAYSVTLTLFVGIIPMIAFKLIHPVYVNKGKSIVVAMLLIVSVIINIIANVILIPSYGAIGASMASVISYSVCGIIFLIKYFLDFIWN